MNEHVNIKYALYKNIIHSHFLHNFTHNLFNLTNLYKTYTNEHEIHLTLYHISVIIDYGTLITRLNEANQFISTCQTD